MREMDANLEQDGNIKNGSSDSRTEAAVDIQDANFAAGKDYKFGGNNMAQRFSSKIGTFYQKNMTTFDDLHITGQALKIYLAISP